MLTRTLSSSAARCCRRAVSSRQYSISLLGMPALSPTMQQGTLVKWRKKVGDPIKSGDIICEVETDKATLDYEHMGDDGFVGKILIAEGAAVPVGSTIAVLVDGEEELGEAAKYEVPAAAGAPAAAAAAEAAPAASAPAASAAPAPAASKSLPPSGSAIASPLAKTLASAAGVSLDKCSRSGPQGQVVAADVVAAIEAGQGTKGGSAPAAGGASGASMDVEVQNVTGMRKVIASRLTESKNTIPHFYLTADAKTAKIQAFVKDLNSHSKDGEFKLSLTDVLVKACALACAKVPAVNSQWHGDHIKKFNRVDISVAVSTPTGLMTPIIFNADLKGLKEISSSIKDLAKKAKDGKLVPEEYQGGTFTISNLGAWGVKHFTAIINPPQSCILAVGTIQRPAGFETNEHDFMTFTLSCDHRIVDGAVGAEWLSHLKKLLENPSLLML